MQNLFGFFDMDISSNIPQITSQWLYTCYECQMNLIGLCLLWIYVAIVENMSFMDIQVYVYVLDIKVSVHIH